MQIQTSHNTLNLGLTVEALVTDLEQNFQHFNATPTDTIETIMFRSGQRSVVNYIKQLLEEDE
jgi:hypothetical protein